MMTSTSNHYDDEPPMPRRVFFDWSRPPLESAARWLIEHAQGLRPSPLLVLPTQRACRRVNELCRSIAAATGLALADPAFAGFQAVTVGELPELLYVQQKDVASPMLRNLAWIEALRALNPEKREGVFPGLQVDETSQLSELAARLQSLHERLGADIWSFKSVAREIAKYPEFPQDDRWLSLAALQDHYYRFLSQEELWDPQAGRNVAIHRQECRSDRPIILIGLADLNRGPRAMLMQCATQVTSLIFCDANEQNGFDEIGCLNSEFWAAHYVNVSDNRIRIVDRPADQAQLVGEFLTVTQNHFQLDQMVIGLPDDNVWPQLERVTQRLGIASHRVEGQRVSDGSIVRLLEHVSEYLDNRSFTHFAEMIRHPDLYRWISERLQRTDWLHEVDSFQNEVLPATVEINQPNQYALKHFSRFPTAEIVQHLGQLLSPVLPGNRPLSSWAEGWLQVLHQIYGEWAILKQEAQELGLTPTDQEMLNADSTSVLKMATDSSGVDIETTEINADPDRVERLGDPQVDPLPEYSVRVLAEHFSEIAANPHAKLTVRSAADSIKVALRFFDKRYVEPPADSNSVDVLGWLDLAFDDRPVMVVTGFNNHVLPAHESGHAFLPNRLCTQLGLTDNQRRFARDVYYVNLIGACRPNLLLIAGRRDSQKNPLQPSRLLMHCDDQSLVRRSQAYFSFDRYHSNQGSRPSTALATRPLAQTLAIPKPSDDMVLPMPMSITRFREYLKCPYRFYLTSILKLEPVSDSSRELSGGQFGDLAHQVLEVFGTDPIHKQDDPALLREFLLDTLSDRAKIWTFKSQLPALTLQIENLEIRLSKFAEIQAEQRRQGWVIVSTEQKIDYTFDVDGRPFTIRGKIDRVDEHDSGKLHVWDYKTRESGKTASKAHRKYDGSWIDLQLPLYRHLIGQLHPAMDPDAIGLGYILIPNNTSKTRFDAAAWTPADLADADHCAMDVMRGILAKRFWPPAPEPPQFADDTADICQDHVFERWQELMT